MTVRVAVPFWEIGPLDAESTSTEGIAVEKKSRFPEKKILRMGGAGRLITCGFVLSFAINHDGGVRESELEVFGM